VLRVRLHVIGAAGAGAHAAAAAGERTADAADWLSAGAGAAARLGGDAEPAAIAGRERRVYALVASLPYSGAQTALFSFEMTLEAWLGGEPQECVYDNLRAALNATEERNGYALEEVGCIRELLLLRPRPLACRLGDRGREG
jgi:hypothetical protein